jgi:hypothetical protein
MEGDCLYKFVPSVRAALDERGHFAILPIVGSKKVLHLDTCQKIALK